MHILWTSIFAHKVIFKLFLRNQKRVIFRYLKSWCFLKLTFDFWFKVGNWYSTKLQTSHLNNCLINSWTFIFISKYLINHGGYIHIFLYIINIRYYQVLNPILIGSILPAYLMIDYLTTEPLRHNSWVRLNTSSLLFP